MSDLRVALVTRRFWPLVGRTETTIAQLAVGLCGLGERPTIVTARWAPDWPSRIVYQGVPVVRLPESRGVGWRTLRFMNALARWLRQHRHEFEVAYVAQDQTNMNSAVRTLQRLGIPTLLRVDDSGHYQHRHGPDASRAGLWLQRHSRDADGIVVGTAAAERDMIRRGCTVEHLHRIRNALSAPPVRTVSRTHDARLALAEVNPDLAVDMDEPVVVYVGRLEQGNGLSKLINVWPEVVHHWPRGRLWLIGDGSLRSSLYQQICDLDLRGRILMPGTFEDIQDILLAANLLLYTGDASRWPTLVPEAICAGVAVLATDTPDMRALQDLASNGITLVDSRDAHAWQREIIRALETRSSVDELAGARRRIVREYSVASMAESHQALLRRLIDQRVEDS